MRLFAERGFRSTTVGDIERAAGLVPRSGALYQHFSSKRDLLEAGLERHIHDLRTIGGVMDLLPLSDLRSELTLLARWLLAELEREREVCMVLEKEGEQFARLRERFYEDVVDAGFRMAAEFGRKRIKEIRGADDVDVDALAVLVVGAIVNYRRTQWTFGHAPLDIDEERFVAGMVDVFGRTVAVHETGLSVG